MEGDGEEEEGRKEICVYRCRVTDSKKRRENQVYMEM